MNWKEIPLATNTRRILRMKPGSVHSLATQRGSTKISVRSNHFPVKITDWTTNTCMYLIVSYKSTYQVWTVWATLNGWVIMFTATVFFVSSYSIQWWSNYNIECYSSTDWDKCALHNWHFRGIHTAGWREIRMRGLKPPMCKMICKGGKLTICHERLLFPLLII